MQPQDLAAPGNERSAKQLQHVAALLQRAGQAISATRFLSLTLRRRRSAEAKMMFRQEVRPRFMAR